MKVDLIEEQKIAKDQIVSFLLKSPVTDDDHFQTLEGYAGTGKTTIMQFVIDEVKNKRKIVVSAPTHKAKEKIGEITKQNAETIQALLGLRPNIELTDFDPKKPIFEIKAEEKIQFYDVIIIDEASMLNKDITALIKKKAIEHKVKVIFVGDRYQLPPVGEVISTVFNLPNIIKLNTINRQSESNPNLKLIELARNDVKNGTDTFLNYIKEINMDMNEEEGFKNLSKDAYYNEMLEHYYDSEYSMNPDKAKIICWTNNAVTVINRWIRHFLIKSEELVAVGDILMGYKPITKEVPYPPFYIPIIKNAVDYIVTSVKIEDVKVFGAIFKCYIVETKDNNSKMCILHRDSYLSFAEELSQRLYTAKSTNKWKPYYDFKDQIACLEPILDQYKNKLCDKDIDYGYAITVHKSQGSTYENVGITLTDILKNRTAKERRQLIYVALSRTSKLNLIYAK